MKHIINKLTFKDQNITYPVEVIYKNNKNTYIRVKEQKIIITTNYLTSFNQLTKLLQNNTQVITKMLHQDQKQIQKNNQFLIFGKEYHIQYQQNTKIEIQNNIIYTKDEKTLSTWLKKYIKTTYQNHLKYWYEQFEENIPIPNLKIRKMKTRWGVCNTKNYNITLNTELIKYDIECLDYVIVHELSHLIEPNHSKAFWNIVSKYYPNYKQTRKKLKE